MSENIPGGSRGLFDSLKVLAASLVAVAYTRLDLLSTEIEEERERVVSVLVVTLSALFCLGVGVVLLAILIVVAFWDGDRLLVLGVLAGLFLASGAVAWGVASRKMKAKPRLFAASLAELSKDQQQLTLRP